MNLHGSNISGNVSESKNYAEYTSWQYIKQSQITKIFPLHECQHDAEAVFTAEQFFNP